MSHVPVGGLIKSGAQQGAVKHHFYYRGIVFLTLLASQILCVTKTTTDAVALCIIILRTCEFEYSISHHFKYAAV